MGDPYIKNVLSGSHDWPRMPGCTSPSEPTPKCYVCTCFHSFPRNRFIHNLIIRYFRYPLSGSKIEWCGASPLCCFQRPTHRLSFVAGLRGASSVCGLGFPARRCEQQRENQDTLSHATQIWRTLTCGWEWMDQVTVPSSKCVQPLWRYSGTLLFTSVTSIRAWQLGNLYDSWSYMMQVKNVDIRSWADKVYLSNELFFSWI